MGGRFKGITHAERSKNMNSSAFSWGESSVREEQQSVVPPSDAAGLATTGSPGNPFDEESLTCREVYTNFPHWSAGAAPSGVLNEKKCVYCAVAVGAVASAGS
jgi:hypothetical protein